MFPLGLRRPIDAQVVPLGKVEDIVPVTTLVEACDDYRIDATADQIDPSPIRRRGRRSRRRGRGSLTAPRSIAGTLGKRIRNLRGEMIARFGMIVLARHRMRKPIPTTTQGCLGSEESCGKEQGYRKEDAVQHVRVIARTSRVDYSMLSLATRPVKQFRLDTILFGCASSELDSATLRPIVTGSISFEVALWSAGGTECESLGLASPGFQTSSL